MIQLTCFSKTLTAAGALLLLLPTLSWGQPKPERVIQQLDIDGDKLVSYEEFQLPRHRGGDRFEAADADGDGNISRAEMEAKLASQIEEMTARAIERFEATDLDGDGFVTPEEIKRSAFDAMDANDDGYISADELSAAHRKKQEQHRHRPQG